MKKTFIISLALLASVIFVSCKNSTKKVTPVTDSIADTTIVDTIHTVK